MHLLLRSGVLRLQVVRGFIQSERNFGQVMKAFKLTEIKERDGKGQRQVLTIVEAAIAADRKLGGIRFSRIIPLSASRPASDTSDA